MKKICKMLSRVILWCAVLCILCVCLINLLVWFSGRSKILTTEEAAALEGVDCIIVFGCQVRANGSLSDMLRDRLTRGLELYEADVAPKLLMSGDHGGQYYDEVGGKGCAF